MLTKYFTASTYRRLFAHWIDSVIVGFCFLPLWIQVVSLWFKETQVAFDLRWVVICFLFQFAYRWLFLYFLSGTLGKLVCGLKVIDRHDEDKALGLMQSFLRVLADHLSVFFGKALASLALYRFDRTHLSDWIAETRVVQYYPRNRPAQRRWAVATLAFLYLLISQFLGTYHIIQTLQWPPIGSLVYIIY